MIVFFNWKTLESALVDMAASSAVPMFMPAPHVGDGQSLHERGEVSVLARPEDQVPVRAHETIAAHAHGNLLHRFIQHAKERGIVVSSLKQLHPPGGAVQMDANGKSIRDAVMALPYNPPAPALMSLAQEMAETGMRLTVSHLLTPTGTVDEAVATITALMRRLIPEAPR